MAEEIAVENGRIFNFEGLVTLTLTLDQFRLLPSSSYKSATSQEDERTAARHATFGQDNTMRLKT